MARVAVSGRVAASNRAAPSSRRPRGNVFLPSVANNYLSTPDTATLSLNSDFTIDVLMSHPTWSITTTSALLAHDNGTTQRAFIFRFVSPTTLALAISGAADGSTVTAASASAALSLTPNTLKWLRVTWRKSDGRVQFFTSNDAITWTQNGTNQTINLGGIFDSSATITIGATSVGNSPLGGNVYAVKMFDALDGGGNMIINVDPSSVAANSSTFTSSLGNVWTVNTSGSPAARIVNRVAA